MKQKYLLLSMILLFFLIFFATSLSIFAVVPNLELTPATQSVPIGTEGTVNVVVEDVTALMAASITLNFDATKLQYSSSAIGNFFLPGFIAGVDDSITGSVTIDFLNLEDEKPSGTGTILTVNFERIAAGDTNITFGATELINGDGNDIVHTKGGGCSFIECIGDFNGDLKVSFPDLIIFALAYNTTPADAKWNPICDLNSDDAIGFPDLIIFAMHYGDDCGGCTPPSPPNLSDPGGTLPSPATYTVNWSSVSGATSYKIQEATSPDFSGATSYTVSSTSKGFSHTATSTCITYYYRVAAIDSCGQSSWSNVVDIQICPCTPPSPPTLSDPGDTLPSPATYTVSWSSVSGATSYEIEEALSPDFSGATSYTVSSTSKGFSHTATSTCITYYYRVAAIDSCGQSSWSNVVDIQICPCIVPPTVTTLPADIITTTSARVCGSIDDTGGEEPFDAGFEIRLKSGGPETVVKYGVGTYCADVTGLTPDTCYEVRFWAENSAGKGYGNWLEFCTHSGIAKWTVMVYMDGDNNLEWCYWHNLGMMESVGSTEEVNIVVQMDPLDDCTGTYRYYITGVEQGSEYPLYPDDIVQSLPEQDMTDPAVLTDFINWAGDNYPADHYMLFLVDHGGGWREEDGFFKGIFQDDTSGSQVMQIPELAQSLDNASIFIDILDLDACLMQMIEVAWEIGKGMSFPPNYLIASEAAGWTPVIPYDDFLAQLTGNPDIEQSVICETIVNGYINNLSPNTGTMSALDLNSFLNNSLDIINNFANALINSMYQNEISNAQLTTQNYAYDIGYRSKDLFDFAERIKNSVPDCQSEAQAVMDLVTNIIIAEEHIGSDMENSHGLSIYLVDSPSEYDSDYDFLQFATDTQWDEFLQHYTPGIVPPTVTTLPAGNITSTSARLYGSIDDTGGEEPFDAGFGIRLKAGGPETVVKYPVGNYYLDITGLTPGTCYEFRFYAENSAGRTYGNYLGFCTGIVPPTVTTLHADNITKTSARVWLSIDDTGGEDPFSAGVYWGLKEKLFYSESETESIGSNVTKIKNITENNKIEEISEAEDPNSTDFYFGEEERISSFKEKYGVGTYYVTLTGLSCNTTYKYRAYAENSAGEGTGDYKYFTTLACSVVPPTVSRGSLYNYSATQVKAYGKIESTGGENPYKAGMFIKDLTTGGAAVGWYITGDFHAGDTYYIIIPNLISGHLYSLCAYAENSAGKGYSDWGNFIKP